MSSSSGHTLIYPITEVLKYSGKENPSLEKSIDTQVMNLVQLIRTKYISTNSSLRPLDLARKAQYFTLDTITDIAFGQAFGDLVRDEDVHKHIQSTEEMLEVLTLLTVFPTLQDLLSNEWIAKLCFPSDTDSTGIGRLIA